MRIEGDGESRYVESVLLRACLWLAVEERASHPSIASSGLSPSMVQSKLLLPMLAFICELVHVHTLFDLNFRA